METITQTNRTILFAEINPQRFNLLTLIGDVRGKNSLDDEKVKEINEELLVSSFEEFLEKMESAGVEVNRERKNLRFRVQGQENYTRCNTLKGDYTEQAIKERISGVRIVSPQRNSTYRQRAKIGLLLDIEAAVRSGKGPGYERWAKVFNLKQLS